MGWVLLKQETLTKLTWSPRSCMLLSIFGTAASCPSSLPYRSSSLSLEVCTGSDVDGEATPVCITASVYGVSTITFLLHYY